jgi:hypothetical protein
MLLNNGCLIQQDDNNETLVLCFICIALLLEARKAETRPLSEDRKVEARPLSEAQKVEARKADMLVVPPPTAKLKPVHCRKPKN